MNGCGYKLDLHHAGLWNEG